MKPPIQDLLDQTPEAGEFKTSREAAREAKHLVIEGSEKKVVRDSRGLPSGSQLDDRLLDREFYNANTFTVTFLLQLEQADYIRLNLKNPGPPRIDVKPGSFQLLQHAFYVAKWPAEFLPEEVILHLNFGDDIGKGIKPNRAQLRKAIKHTGQKKIF